VLHIEAVGLSFHLEEIIMRQAAAAAERCHAGAEERSGRTAWRPVLAGSAPCQQMSVAATTPSSVARTSARHRVALHAVAKDQTSAIIIAPGGAGLPAWSGTGDWDYVCGSCTALLCAGVESERRFPSLVFRCVCGVLNRSS
jgi:hypothetical protein